MPHTTRFSMQAGGSIQINGQTIETGPGARVEVDPDGTVRVDGTEQDRSLTAERKTVTVEVNGDTGDIEASGDVRVTGSAGRVAADGDVTCGDVRGNVAADGDVRCGDVAGNVAADGDVVAGSIRGRASADGDITTG